MKNTQVSTNKIKIQQEQGVYVQGAIFFESIL